VASQGAAMATERAYLQSEAPRPRPNIEHLLALLERPFIVRSVALTLLVIMAAFYTIYFARDVLMPITAALVLQFVVSPVMRGLGRLRIPAPVGAAIIILGLLGAIGGGVYYLSGPAGEWMERLPTVARQLQERLHVLKGPVEKVKRASDEVEKAATVGGGQVEVTVRPPGFLEQVATGLRKVVVQIGIILGLLFFLLASGDMFKLKLVRVIPRLHDKKRAVTILNEIERHVSAYLFTVLIVNVSLGTAVGVGLWLIGMPNAALWGVMAGILTFLPLIGSTIGTIIVTIAAVLSFDSLSHALLAPAVYIAVAIAEAQIVAPILLGRNLTLNPVVIMVSMLLWGWMWGIPGVLLAVPILATIKALCDHIEPLAAIGEFLSDRRSSEPNAAH
jgi:predicted PurR-regulated permease PerM